MALVDDDVLPQVLSKELAITHYNLIGGDYDRDGGDPLSDFGELDAPSKHFPLGLRAMIEYDRNLKTKQRIREKP